MSGIGTSNGTNSGYRQYGLSPEDFLRLSRAVLPNSYFAGRGGVIGLPPSTDKVLAFLNKHSCATPMNNIPRGISHDIAALRTSLLKEYGKDLVYAIKRGTSHLTIGEKIEELHKARFYTQQRPMHIAVGCPTMPRDTMSDSFLEEGAVFKNAAAQIAEMHNGHNSAELGLTFFLTPNYPGESFLDTRDSSVLQEERKRLFSFALQEAERENPNIGGIDLVYPNHKLFFKLWDELGLPQLKYKGKGTALFVASLAVAARHYQQGISSENGFFTTADTDLKIPSEGYLTGLIYAGLDGCAAAIASFFRMNEHGHETGRLCVVMKAFLDAVDYVWGKKLGGITKRLCEITYPLAGERLQRMDLLLDSPIPDGYYAETMHNIHLAKLIEAGALKPDDVGMVNLGFYAHHNQALDVKELRKRGETKGATLHDMAKEIIGKMLPDLFAIADERGVELTQREVTSIASLTSVLSEIAASEREELANETRITRSRSSVVTELAGFFVSQFSVMAEEIFKKRSSGEGVAQLPHLTLKKVLGAGDPDRIFKTVNQILDRSNKGITPDELVPFES